MFCRVCSSLIFSETGDEKVANPIGSTHFVAPSPAIVKPVVGCNTSGWLQ
jgi:hypothetical protein